MPARKSLRELIEAHEAKALYAERKAQEWLAKAAVSRNRADALKQQAKDAVGVA